MTTKCIECGATVKPDDAVASYEKYGDVTCMECIRKIEADEPLPSEIAEDHPRNKTIPQNEIVPDDACQNTPELTINDVKKYICPGATDREAYAFMKLCSARNLNPFTKEAYLIKYGDSPATVIVGKDAFTRRAEEHPQFDGFVAGIIVDCGEKGEFAVVDEREGTFLHDGETLLGGWAKVYRKDHSHTVVAKVSIKEYIGINKKTGKPNSQWAKMPATMIRKVALVQALRESFPSGLGGCYDASEMGDM